MPDVAEPTLRRLVRWSAEHPSALLMVAQLLSLLVYPFLGDAVAGRTMVGVLAIVVLALAVFAVRATESQTWISMTLGVPALLLTVAEALHPGIAWLVIVSAVIHAAFYLYTAYALLRYMFHDDHVTHDELWATGATFTVVAWGFAYLYSAVQTVWPGSFTAAIDAEAPRTWIELLFLSITTMTSTGLSDIIPVLPQARSVVMIEQIAGMLYIALVIARIMALLSAKRARSR
ncbi:ion channel [Naumannella halotolerans]|uniref:Ion channel n=1 Tax=Naumannella halotolerans TaxID=993414 RepID=A0A4V3ENA1_9ACTN|nr:ion channel [Naumannella halotolerans]TDT32948.1 ion channel [Naumannella halotolerans]